MALEQSIVSGSLNPAAVKVLRNTYTLLSLTLVFSAAIVCSSNGRQCTLHGSMDACSIHRLPMDGGEKQK